MDWSTVKPGTKIRGLDSGAMYTFVRYVPHQHQVVGADVGGTEWTLTPSRITLSAPTPQFAPDIPAPEFTGKSVNYYKVDVTNPTTKDNPPYTAECNDIIEALGMNYAEGNAFKALWRKAAAKSLGKHKQGNTALYDAEKVAFFGERLVVQETKK